MIALLEFYLRNIPFFVCSNPSQFGKIRFCTDNHMLCSVGISLYVLKQLSDTSVSFLYFIIIILLALSYWSWEFRGKLFRNKYMYIVIAISIIFYYTPQPAFKIIQRFIIIQICFPQYFPQ